MPRIKRIIPAGFTTVNNDFLRDVSLSLAARGLLMTMLSLPDGWNMSGKGFAAILPDGRDKVYSTLNILEEKGYLKREQIRQNGRFVDTEYQFCDSPIFLNQKKVVPKTAKKKKSVKNKQELKLEESAMDLPPISISSERKCAKEIISCCKTLSDHELTSFVSSDILEFDQCVKNFHISQEYFDDILNQFISVYQEYPEIREKLVNFSSADVAYIIEKMQEDGHRKTAAKDYFIKEKPILEI